MKRGMLTIVSGFSGAGKSSVTKGLVADYPGYWLSVSCTTRDPREGEQEGREYYFKTKPDFEKLIGEDSFLEFAEYAGNYYGTPKRYVDEAMDAGRDVILEIEMQGARQVCAKRPETIRIFIAPPSWEELERRLVNRGTDAPEKIAQRLRQARVELENAGEYDYMVVNETVEKAAEEVAAILCAEHCRVDGRLEEILKK